ncbi:alpha/beta-hydrolase [Neocallimastix lanati (nom. inval.)]|nr:alpha/beta-hydrolase [Neocallimastix sp. JGI-2020a]
MKSINKFRNELFRTKTFKPEDIIVRGGSSGGNLSLTLTLKLQKEQNIAPKAGFFFSPDTDLTLSGKSFFDNYRKDITVSPLFGDYTTFLRSFFVVGGDEMTLDDTLRVVDKIKANGHEVELINKEGMCLVFNISGSFTPEGKEANVAVEKFIVESFEK